MTTKQITAIVIAAAITAVVTKWMEKRVFVAASENAADSARRGVPITDDGGKVVAVGAPLNAYPPAGIWHSLPEVPTDTMHNPGEVIIGWSMDGRYPIYGPPELAGHIYT